MPRPRKDRLFGPELPRIPARAFPSTLAAVVHKRWNFVCGGTYVTPPCPSKPLLRAVLETAYLASSSPEEDRFPKFNIIATPIGGLGEEHYIGHKWPFSNQRVLSVSELRRLAPAVDIKKSAIWAVWSDSGWRIAGLVDFGTSWHRARMGLEYTYQGPACLMIQIDRPGRIRVYQGSFHVATLTDGVVEGHEGISFHLSLHAAAHRGLRAIAKDLSRPKIEEPRETANFEFLALWNTYVAIANSIAQLGHGGALVIVPPNAEVSSGLLKIKYEQRSPILRSAFVEFMNARHIVGDIYASQENEEEISEESVALADTNYRRAFSDLIEATRFVAQLSGCDGAIVITDDLELVGFGIEIKAEMRNDLKF
jgi:sensor domain DACNV-containing protein